MPSERSLKAKQQFVSELVDKIKSSNVGILVSYKGINVENDTKLRREMREAGVNYFVVKNTMLRFASKEVGYDFDEKLTGTTALALSPEDPVSVAKILTKYAKELGENTEFALKTGFLDGKIIDVDTIVEIGSLPSKEQLIGQLLSVLVAPIRGLAVALNAVAEKDPEDAVTEENSDTNDANKTADAKTDEKADTKKAADVKADKKADTDKAADVKADEKADTEKTADIKASEKADTDKAADVKADEKDETEKAADIKGVEIDG
ncbi:MAG: 50S ribosomal protein L10, partial [Oscillospiraceae bacterium]|nr:50S ribosomal protein L10 [Oscillospiraceae bacterium]